MLLIIPTPIESFRKQETSPLNEATVLKKIFFQLVFFVPKANVII